MKLIKISDWVKIKYIEENGGEILIISHPQIEGEAIGHYDDRGISIQFYFDVDPEDVDNVKQRMNELKRLLELYSIPFIEEGDEHSCGFIVISKEWFEPQQQS